MLLNVLTEAANASAWPTYVMLGIVVIAFVAMTMYSRRIQKKRQQEQEETMKLHNAIQPGNKVKTIGGICGVVVEVCDDDNTFVVETGTEKSGKSYIKFDKQAIYQTDAVVEDKAPVEEKTQEPAQEN